jgi:hypothetical protein
MFVMLSLRAINGNIFFDKGYFFLMLFFCIRFNFMLHDELGKGVQKIVGIFIFDDCMVSWIFFRFLMDYYFREFNFDFFEGLGRSNV